VRRYSQGRLPVRQVVAVLVLSGGVMLTGTLGFSFIEGQPLFDSFYMTLITLTTIGYAEVIELSERGRYFNSALIMAGYIVVFAAIGVMANSLLQLELHNYFGRRRTKRMIDRMSDHYIVCGLGRVGRGVVEWLARNNATVMAIQRHGINLPGRLAEVALEAGDILLLHGDAEPLHRLAEEPGFIPMGEVPAPFRGRPRAWVAAVILGGVMAAAASGATSITTAAATGVLAMIFLGCVRIEEVYRELNWLVVFVLAGLIPLGIALETTGAADWVASGVLSATMGAGDIGIIGAFYLVTALMTAVVSNAATAVVLTPVAILAAQGAGINPYALLITVMFAASASFSTPFGYQTNVMIYSPGGYRFTDFLRVGGPLSLVHMVCVVFWVYWFWR